MDFENMKSEFPKMPKEIENRIDELVRQQMENEPQKKQKDMRGFFMRNCRRAAVFAVVLLMGTSSVVYAAKKVYKMYVDQQGKYQTDIGIETSDAVSATDSAETKQNVTVPDRIPKLCVDFSYKPDGYAAQGDGTGDIFSEAGGSIWTRAVVMTNAFLKGQETFEEKYVVESKEIAVDGHEAVLYKKSDGYHVLNILYPEYYQIINVNFSSDLTDSVVQAVISGVSIEDTGAWQETDYMWNIDEINHPKSDGSMTKESRSADREATRIYQAGDSFVIEALANNEVFPLTACVTDVTVTQDLSILQNQEKIPDEWKALQNGDGGLKQVELMFVKSGDGVNTLDQVVKTEKKDVRLVDIAVKYTNQTGNTLTNILHNCAISVIDINGDLMEMAGVEAAYQKENDGSEFDYIRSPSLVTNEEMFYYDTLDADGKNYIPKLEPGESITVHYAQVIYAEELPKLYANVGERIGYCFSEESLRNGYVDIRQDAE